METFHFLIPTSVIAEMGLLHDGQTVSRWVRLCDLFADGTLSANDYHALALAGVVVTQQHLFTFESVEETAQGWNCHQIEPEPNAWPHTLSFLREVFPNITPTEGGYKNSMVCPYEWIDRLPIDWQEMTLLTVEGPLSVSVSDTLGEDTVTLQAVTQSSEPLKDLIDYNA